jgi:hypothetical protein
MAVIDLTPARMGVQTQAPPMARGGLDLGRARPVEQPRMNAADPIGAAVGQLGAAIGELDAAARRARQADAVAGAQAEYYAGLADLRGRLEANDPEFAGDAVSAFTTRAAELRDRVAERIQDGGARNTFTRAASLDIARDRIDVVRFTARRQAESSRAALMGEMDGYAQRAAAATEPGLRARELAAAEAAITARVASGALGADDGERMRQGFRSQVDEAGVRNLLTTNPAAAVRALSDPALFPGLRADRRAMLMDTASNRADAAADRALRQSELAERRAERTARLGADRAANEFLGLVDAAQRGEPGAVMPGREFLDRHRDYLAPGEYRALLAARNAAPPERDDPRTIADLQPRVHTDDPDTFRREAARALETGRIRVETYRSMIQQNEGARRDDAPASAFRSGRSFVSDALDPGNVVGGEFMRGPLAEARSRALADYDRWFRQNPNASADVAMAQADQLVMRYRQGSAAQSRAALPRPYGFTGGRDQVSEDTLRAAAAALLRARETGQIDAMELARETSILEAWRSLPRPAQQPAQQQGGPRGGGARL